MHFQRYDEQHDINDEFSLILTFSHHKLHTMVFSLLNLEENLDNFILTDELNALLPLS